MTNASIGVNNLVDSAVSLSATNASGNLPVTNLRVHQISQVFRCTSSTTTIDMDAGSQVTKGQIAAIGTTLTSNATIRVQLSNNALGSTDVLDTGVVSLSVDDLFKTAFYDLGDQTAQYWRIIIEDTSLSQFDIGRLVVPEVLRFSPNIAYPLNIRYRDLSDVKRTVGGQEIRYRRSRPREIDWRYTIGLSEADQVTLMREVDKTVGTSADILFVSDAEATYLHEWLVWGAPSELGAAGLTGINQRSKSYTIRETL
jgi:hypothetical protein